MSEFFRTAIYTKNISNTERTLRLVAAVGVAVPAALYLSEPWMRWTALGSAAMFVVTGVFGFCPACYMAGRKLSKQGA
jgi:hypothetical protein